MNTICFVGEHPRTFDVRWHVHKAWELVYCTGGQGAFHFKDGSRIDYAAGYMVAIPPEVVHCNVSEEGFTNIHINIQSPSFAQQNAFCIIDEDDSLLGAFTQARKYYMSDKNRHELVTHALGELIASYIIVRSSNSEYSKPVEQLRSSIMENYHSVSYDLEEAIRALPFHYDYVRRLFKKEIGMSPLEYLTSLRMRNAEYLLNIRIENGYTIGEIAQMCGFGNALYFSRVFKKHFDCSPSDFCRSRNAAQKESAAQREEGDKEE